MKSYFTRYTIFWTYFFAILILIAIPVGNENMTNLNNIYLLHFRGDYLVHALMFLPWCFLMPGSRLSMWWWLPAGIVFAVGTESLQYLLPYRAFNINDMIANALGVILGFVLMIFWQHLRRESRISK
ncbi:MAG: VanZ family protein [Tenuifilaceae bacterium]|jgi:VanZ family protein|nr:VanZ family protein [Bacteroidales bacterium]MDD2285213.1 VanZ family protein [Paludibacter sp.]MDD4428857.1 VanZ family protein [Paludibacter sp.]MDY0202137.1 VanZ family protein [Tenuifilaceae bacterium]